MKITENITITNEDNMLLMARYPDNHFDLAIVDLEYCIGASKPSDKSGFVKQKNGTELFVKQPNYTPKDWDFKKSSPEYFKELFRVSKKQIVKGGNYYGLYGGYLVWNKLNGESDQFDCELFWLSFTQRTDNFYFMWAGMMQGIYCGKDIKQALVQQGDKFKNEKRIHPTQTPVPVYKYLLHNYAKPGDKILDTHLGSGSIAIACHDYGFELTACELDKDYYNDSIKRIKNHVSQLKLQI
ncbi:DNA methyltransferase [uncultured Chryseobacterium sp.]|uniref:DNA methyltransferase n=1 Tax=uncultured Chryseobacterium sp. TaxID=259322 RepID=UPI0025892143|nr:DNA methyltransferase [uncultured Chryseobacterium sp.]